MTDPYLLLFDLGGVLTENSTFTSLNELLPQTENQQAIKERWLFSPTVRLFELGEINAAEFAERFVVEWALELSAEEFLPAFVSWSKGFFPGARDTLLTLRQKYQVGCLSNSNPLHWQKFRDFAEDFDIALFSHLLGVIKPDREAFALALNASGLLPAQIYYYDDAPANVRIAAELGMQAFHVEGFTDLLQLLNQQGLLAD